MSKFKLELEQRLLGFVDWSTVTSLDSCWNWKTTRRYGRIKVLNQETLAHRLSYCLYYQIDTVIFDEDSILHPRNVKDLVCHSCDNGRCVNPCHLFLGTALINSRDRQHKHGKLVPRFKLTAEDRLRIKQMRLDGMNGQQIANEFKVNRSTINKLLAGTTW